jgi:hypothetical protein
VLDREGNRHFHVDRLVDSRKLPGHEREYRVRWRGYDPSQDSWEPEGVLRTDVPDLVNDFHRRHGRTPSQ